MKETADNKNMTSVERRILKFFFALTDKEKDIGELAKTLGVSVSTAKRYANILEKAGIARVRNKNYRHGKSAMLCKNVYFSVVRIGKNTVEISLVSFLPKYEYSVILPYNESLSNVDNAIYIKRTLDNLCAQARSEKTLARLVLSDGACIEESVCREIFYKAPCSAFKGEILTTDKQKAQDISAESVISALVIEMIRNIRAQNGN
ncbi:MAG: winged helix-turn-helix transcriptional regulator [Ruminococcaceae bacterium]|nr:winged helix-turn-helix transcriptional regulator [Oscillospiraceae bacterium]